MINKLLRNLLFIGMVSLLLAMFTYTGAYAQAIYESVWETSDRADNLPEWFENNRGGAFGHIDGEDRFIVANVDAAWVLDAEDGSEIRELSIDGIEESPLFNINTVATTDDGVIIGSGLSLNIADEGAFGGGPYVVNMWEDEDSDPVNIINFEDDENEHRLGDQFNVVGSYEDGTAQIISAASGQPYIYVWSMDDGEFDSDNPEIVEIDADDIEGDIGTNPNAYPVGDDMWIFNSNNISPVLLNADGEVLGQIDPDIVDVDTNNIKVVNEEDDTFYFITLLPNFQTEENSKVQFVRVLDGDMDNAESLGTTPSLGNEENTNASGAVDFIETEDGFDFFIIEAFNGIARFQEQDVIEVDNIADLIADDQEGETYQITGEVIVTYVDSENRNQHYIGDDSGAILIDDAGEVLGDDFEIGDGMEGLTAEFSIFNDTRQVVPASNPGVSSSDNELPVFDVELADLDTDEHQSMLVEVADASFPEAEGTFENSDNYDVVDPSIDAESAATFTTHSLADDLDYFGYNIPEEEFDLRAIVTEFQGNPQVTARSQDDFMDIELTEPEPEGFTVYYNNPDDWDEVYIWAWEEEGDNLFDEWPGESMNEPEEGSEWWSYDLPENIDMVIFNNAGEGEQTDDLMRNTTGWYDGVMWFDDEPDYTEYASIAEMLDQAEIGDMVRLTNEAYMVFQQNFRNKKVFVDPTGGINIDDAPEGIFDPGIIETEYQRYDGVTNLTGELTEFGGLIELEPVGDPGEATSSDNAIFPTRTTLEELDESYVGQLVLVENVEFDDQGQWDTGESYTITDPTSDDPEAIFYTDFFDADYIEEGFDLPRDPVDLVGYVAINDGQLHITARENSDFIDPEVLGGFELLFPENEMTLEVEGPGSEEIPINWEDSESDSDVSYQWMAQVQGLNFSPPELVFTSDDNGAESMLTLTRAMVDEALDGVGIEEGEEITLTWSVLASEADGGAYRYANEDFTLTLERGEVTSSERETETPQKVSLSQNYPNPFNPNTTIEYQIPSNTHVELTVYNSLGQEVQTLVNEQMQAGTHEVSFDGSNLASGVYIYRLQADGQVITNQMTLVK